MSSWRRLSKHVYVSAKLGWVSSWDVLYSSIYNKKCRKTDKEHYTLFPNAIPDAHTCVQYVCMSLGERGEWTIRREEMESADEIVCGWCGSGWRRWMDVEKQGKRPMTRCEVIRGSWGYCFLWTVNYDFFSHSFLSHNTLFVGAAQVCWRYSRTVCLYECSVLGVELW